MLLRENLVKILVKNWTSFIDIHLLTGLVRDFVQKTEFDKTDVPEGIVYPQNGVRIKVSNIMPDTKGLRITLDFSAPKNGAVVVGEMELSVKEDGVDIETFYGRLVSSTTSHHPSATHS